MRRVSSLSFRFSLLQFYHFYPWDLLKIPDVGCGDGVIQGNGGSGDDEVVGSHGPSLSSDGGPDAGVDPANHQIESVFRCDPAVLP